jgi:hypothetical protein
VVAAVVWGLSRATNVKYVKHADRQSFISEDGPNPLRTLLAKARCKEVKKCVNLLRELYSSSSIIRIIKSKRMIWAGHIARMGEKKNAYGLLARKPEGKSPLRRLRRTWVDNIKMDLGGVGWGDVDWIGLAQDRNTWRALVNSALILRVP